MQSRSCLWAFVVAFAAAISGCGGGGGASSDENTPVPPLPPPPGTLDASFGTGGTVITPIGVRAHATAVVIQPDGKIVVAGYATPDLDRLNLTVARYNSDGTLDSGFGSGGIASEVGLESATSYPSVGLALQADGKIVAAGVSHQGKPETAYCTLARFTSLGVLDPTFGVGGVVTTQIATVPPDTACEGVAVQSDGKIVSAAAGVRRIGVIRFNADGTRDASFGTGGEAVVATKYPAAGASAIVIQSDGKIVVGGDSGGFSSAPGVPFVGEFQLARFEANGGLDGTFGQGGTIQGTVSNTASPLLGSVSLQPDGKLVVVVNADVLRFLSNGTPDTGFGVAGTIANVDGYLGYAGALQSNGKIVVAGTVPSSPTTQNFAVWCLDANGNLDSTFGSGGSVSTPIGTTAIAWGVTIQSNGRIVAVGQADTASRHPGDSRSTRPNFALARYDGD